MVGVFGWWAVTSRREAHTQQMIFSQTERRRWREATLWGETADEEYNAYSRTRNVPGRMEVPVLAHEQPHYEPTNLVVRGSQYQPPDRWTNRLNSFRF